MGAIYDLIMVVVLFVFMLLQMWFLVGCIIFERKEIKPPEVLSKYPPKKVLNYGGPLLYILLKIFSKTIWKSKK